MIQEVSEVLQPIEKQSKASGGTKLSGKNGDDEDDDEETKGLS